MELRYYRFIENHKIKKVFELKTEDLNNKEKISEMFEYFGIEHHNISENFRKNTNEQRVFLKTVITDNEIREYEEFIKLVPAKLLKKIKYIENYGPKLAITF